MFTTIGQLIRNQVKTLMTILIVSASAWAGNHQICYQLPTAASQPFQARFLCRTDGNVPCQITSVQPDQNTSGNVWSTPNVFAGPDYWGVDKNISVAGTYVGTIQFGDGTMRNCTVEIKSATVFAGTVASGFMSTNGTLIGFTTDASGLVMTGVWQATSAAADVAQQLVAVPPDFVAVGGGAEGTETPQGTLVTMSNHYNSSVSPQFWSAAAHGNAPALTASQISPVIGWAIGLKIEGVSIASLRQSVQYPIANSTCCEAHPNVTQTLSNGGVDPTVYPQTVAAISGGVQAGQFSSNLGQYVTMTQPGVSQQCYAGGTCEQLVRSWSDASKDHINSSPWWIVSQMTTLPKVLTINGSTFHVETWVSNATSAQAAHPSSTASLPGGFALTGIGASVNWQTSPSAAGNMLWRLKPRTDINGVEAASKDQWWSSPASITGYAIGMKLAPGPVPPLRFVVLVPLF